MSKTLWAVVIVVALLVIAQAARPDMSLPNSDPAHAIDKAAAVPPAVDEILKRSCYDCHSSKTRWPWYSKIAPSSWLLARDVNAGRKELSFSEFATYQPRKQYHKLEEACDQVKQGDMPLWFYLPLHPGAKLSDADKQTFCTWTQQVRAQIAAVHPEAATPGPKPAPGAEH
jgi:hypothetical protein